MCPGDQFACPDRLTCVLSCNRCDGVSQCPKGEVFGGGEEDEGDFCEGESGDGSGESEEGSGESEEGSGESEEGSEEGSGEGLEIDLLDLRSGV